MVRAPLLRLVSELYRVPGLILSISMGMKSQTVVDYAAIGCFLLMLATKVFALNHPLILCNDIHFNTCVHRMRKPARTLRFHKWLSI